MKEIIRNSFAKGVAFSLGIFATSIFAAAMSMTIFSSGQVVSSADVNKNFEIAAPEGAVMAFYLASCPDGWAPADGTGGTPDLRGQFIRGRDDVGSAAGAAGNDPGGSRPIGDPQLDAFQGHNAFSAFKVQSNGAGGTTAITQGTSASTFSNIISTLADDGTNGAPRTGLETRPKNIALTYCMRKN